MEDHKRMTIERRPVMCSIMILLCVLSSVPGFSQEFPKREFRGAWIATVVNLDWPSSPSSTPDVQQSELRILLDQLRAVGITSVLFQVRAECDALYASSIEPWSYYLTGNQGDAPHPLYDPLEFAVQEAHQRGMELHAWLNPYRAVRSVGSYPLAANHVSLLHPDWIITINTFKFLNPGLPAVREYVAGVVSDIVRRYDVDGIHFDDYFYPYPPDAITNQDDQTFADYSRGFSNRGDWRRDNVNLLVAQVHDSIHTLKSWVKFGISPFGIWKNGVPPGITGLDAYSEIYCDAMAWLHQQKVDYLTPQLYWAIGGAQDYAKLMPWWADSTEAYGRHLYTGHAAYRIVSGTNPWSAAELPAQIVLNRGNPKTDGSVFFRAKNGLTDNPKGFADSLMRHLYRYPGLWPAMAWHDSVEPYMPRGLRYEAMNGTGPAALFWDLPYIAPDGDSAWMYAVYSFDHNPTLPGEIGDAKNLIAVGQRRSNTPPVPASGPHYYLVTALDRSGNESLWSSVVSVSAPSVPVLITPVEDAQAPTDTVRLLWRSSPLASGYNLQVSTDSVFTGTLFIRDSSVVDTFRVVRGLTGQSVYYWRVRAENAGGAGVFSLPNRLRADFPLASGLAYPPNYAVNMPVTLILRWKSSPAATSYRLQISPSSNFGSAFADSSGITDTSCTLIGLQSFTVYYWRIKAVNASGSSGWSAPWAFRTLSAATVREIPGLPPENELSQNYPNPFNPISEVGFRIAEGGHVMLKVYDILGREVAVLVDEQMQPGSYSVRFDGSRLSSGVYIYRLQAGSFVATKRMILLH